MDLNLGSTKALIDESRRQGLLRNQCAYVLATAFWETGGAMKPVKETTSKKNPNPTDAQVKRILTRAWKAGKLPWVKKDYWSAGYFGRGYPQLTHLPNYKKAGDKLGVDFVTHPEKVMEDRYAIPICVIGMKEGWFTTKKLSDYLTADKSDFFNARSIINSDKNVKDKGDKESHGQKIAKMARDYDMDLEVLGYGPKKPASKPQKPATLLQTVEAPSPIVTPEVVQVAAPVALVIDKAVIAKVQTDLTALGYNPGGADGIMGPLTKGAILSFRNDNDMIVKDEIDDEFLLKLQTASPRKMVPERANATPAQVASMVPEAKVHWWTRLSAGVLGGSVGGVGLLDQITPAVGYLTPVKDFIGDVPPAVWIGGIVLVCALLYFGAQYGANKATQAYREGDRR